MHSGAWMMEIVGSYIQGGSANRECDQICCGGSVILIGVSGLSISVTSNTSGTEKGPKRGMALVQNPFVTEALEKSLEGLVTILRSKKGVREIPCGLSRGQMDRLLVTFKIP
ncbi:conserved hypothetical protein [Ricinus communis]|uniref:Uncharacterized protein n=1 Tax=Ricinus communis TaxID=3988 RepID=B9RYT7_RICCO|nr:conserved hypothetical protein [Ricinus communis]